MNEILTAAACAATVGAAMLSVPTVLAYWRDRLPYVLEDMRHRVVRALGGRIGSESLSYGEVEDIPSIKWPPVRGHAYYTTAIHHVERGQIRKLDWQDTLALPTGVSGLSFSRGHTDPEKLQWKLTETARIMPRIAPWVRVYVGCNIIRIAKGGIREPWGVAALAQVPGEPSAILIEANLALSHYLQVLYHEIWHVIEHDALNAEARATLDRECATGSAYDHETYHASKIERRARAFAAWAVLREEAPSLAVVRPSKDGKLSMTEIFEAVYGGAIAEQKGRDYLGLCGSDAAENVAEMLASQGRCEDGVRDTLERALFVWTSAMDRGFDDPLCGPLTELASHAMGVAAHVRSEREAG